ncbi:glycerol-3-phosphate dehydrogenase/oxidase [Evansella sp. AB-P1]|uniref:glycerol-3-phosphate dehydrogenase/oxidase n=1 Tax=Evansella sp. AB-P1 TaxID=3037653 RepID=UPI00241D9294|nr:glycerol-3-phosphate dehydrogenase/oxidase [Evansella sp. AB-P1]MDG5786302.1 glycerol-3-phosphate dehydrogenase/oxidase [Evansella sp. AB-P1]
MTKMKRFSAEYRRHYLEEMSEKELDVLVIGGGITGAGIILDASSRGLKTGLLEMQDFASGTSSRSTKLVHGGLRYLKQFDIKLVSEVAKERKVVYENAPHVTTPVPMLLPIIKGGTFGKISTSIGLKVYDYLAKVKKKEKRIMLNRKETLRREPLLRKEGLKGCGAYVEYQTDDARLTIEVLKEAVKRDAIAVNYAKVVQFIYKESQVTGVVVKDVIHNKEYNIKAKKIINATGPWVDTLREEDRSRDGKRLFLSKGVHIVVDKQRLPLKHAIYFDTEHDGRMLFAIPRDHKVYIGTTDTAFDGDIANPKMTEEDVNYLLNAANYIFPTAQLTKIDVESSWAGIRPLIHEEGKKASEISRKDEVFISPSGLISIAGGKLTGYRKMAEKIVNMICRDLELRSICITEKLPLSGGHIGGSNKLEKYIEEKVKVGVKYGLDETEALSLVRRYGANVETIFKEMRGNNRISIRQSAMPDSLFASLKYGIEEEMVTSPIDFYNRRTGILLFNINEVNKYKDEVLDYLSYRLKWSAREKEKHRHSLEKEMNRTL